MDWPDWIKFASDATRFAIVGGLLLLVALIAFLGDKRRAGRKHPDHVGIMPWRDIGALSTFAGLVLLAFAAMGWLKG